MVRDFQNAHYSDYNAICIILVSPTSEQPYDIAKKIATVKEEPEHPRYREKRERISSYATWPASMKQRPGELADAGFYYSCKFSYNISGLLIMLYFFYSKRRQSNLLPVWRWPQRLGHRGPPMERTRLLVFFLPSCQGSHGKRLCQKSKTDEGKNQQINN